MQEFVQMDNAPQCLYDLLKIKGWRDDCGMVEN